jgi:hypothetical protein
MGHNEDELVKVEGEWIFTNRTNFKGNAAWAASGESTAG